MRPNHAIKIVVDQQGVKFHKGLPKVHQHEVLDFFEKTLAIDGKLTIYGDGRQSGYWQLIFKGQIDAGKQHQIRNFFNNM
jgi:hypothetical protein